MLPLNVVMINVMAASVNVNAMLPLKLAPFKIGINPKISGSKNQEVMDKFNDINKQFQSERLEFIKKDFEDLSYFNPFYLKDFKTN